MRPRTGRPVRPFARSPAKIPAAAVGRKLSPRTPVTAVRVPRRPGRTTDRDRGRPAHAARAPPPRTKGRVPSRGRSHIPTKRHASAPPDGNRILSGKAQRLSSPRRPLSAPANNTTDRVFVRRGTQSPPSPAGSHETPCD